jgi:hypothetical protein
MNSPRRIDDSSRLSDIYLHAKGLWDSLGVFFLSGGVRPNSLLATLFVSEYQ